MREAGAEKRLLASSLPAARRSDAAGSALEGVS